MEIQSYVSFKEKTNYKIGPYIRFLLEPRNLFDCFEALYFIRSKKIPFFFVGGATNVLIGEEFFNGAILSTQELKGITLYEDQIHALAGTLNTDLAEFALKNSISGLEFMYYLPGTVGGSTFMNARCFGSSFSDCIDKVITINNKSFFEIFSNKASYFDYKFSIFQKNRYLISSVIFKKLKRGNPENIKKKMDEIKAYRIQKGHFEYPNAGCVFKNNYQIGIPSGNLIDSLGLKNLSYKGASIYEKHANFIINKNNASARDVYILSQIIQQKIYDKWNFLLDYEIQLLGNF